MPASFVVTFCRRRVRLLAAGASVSAETRKPIYRIRRYCKATSEYSPIRSIGLTLLSGIGRGVPFVQSVCWVWQWHKGRKVLEEGFMQWEQLLKR